AAARVAGLPPGCERMEGRTQSAVLGGGRRALATVAAGLGAVLAPWCWLSGLSWRGSALAGAVGGCKPSTQACSALAALANHRDLLAAHAPVLRVDLVDDDRHALRLLVQHLLQEAGDARD